MNNKINIAELLKDAPKGTKLYSPIYGEVEFDRIENDSIYVLFRTAEDDYYYQNFFSDGRFLPYPDSECLLFPSRDCRTWENFKAPWLHKVFSPFSKVLVSEERIWMPASYSYYNEKLKRHVMTNGLSYSDNDILPYECNERLVGKETSETTDD